MKEFQGIADMELIGVFPDGGTRKVRLRIGKPYAIGHGDFDCPVAAEGLHQRLPAVRGLGSWHALMLGIRLLKELLETEVRRGVVFHWPGAEHAISVEELFVRHHIG